MMIRKLSVWPLIMCAAVAGCSSRPPQPRTTADIARERLDLPGLFMTMSGKQVTAPRNSPPAVESGTKEILWPALECTNPECPGRDASGKPFLFVHPSPGAAVGASGKIEFHEVDRSQYTSPECPRCKERRTPANETPEVRSQYLGFVRPYTLPETAEKEKQLEAEAMQLLKGSP